MNKTKLAVSVMAIGLSVLGVQAQNTSGSGIFTFSLTALVWGDERDPTETMDKAGNVIVYKRIYKCVKVKITNQDILNLMTNDYGGKFPAGAMLVITGDAEDFDESGGVAIQVSDKTGTNVLWTPESFRIGDSLTGDSLTIEECDTLLETAGYTRVNTWARGYIPDYEDYDQERRFHRTAIAEVGSSVSHHLKTIAFRVEGENFSVSGDFIASDSWNEKWVRSKDGVWTETEVRKSTGKASVVGSGAFFKRVQSNECESHGIVSGTISVTGSYTRKITDGRPDLW